MLPARSWLYYLCLQGRTRHSEYACHLFSSDQNQQMSKGAFGKAYHLCKDKKRTAVKIIATVRAQIESSKEAHMSIMNKTEAAIELVITSCQVNLHVQLLPVLWRAQDHCPGSQVRPLHHTIVNVEKPGCSKCCYCTFVCIRGALLSYHTRFRRMMLDVLEDQQELLQAFKDVWTSTSSHEDQGWTMLVTLKLFLKLLILFVLGMTGPVSSSKIEWTRRLPTRYTVMELNSAWHWCICVRV